jgi:hypothetical protein
MFLRNVGCILQTTQRNTPEDDTLNTTLFVAYCVLVSSTLKTEAVHTSETSVNYQATRRFNAECSTTLHSHRCENLKSNFNILYFAE